MVDKIALTAPCGFDCFNCEIYEENLTEEFSELIHTKSGVAKEKIPCKGCRVQDGKHYHLADGCATLDCAKGRGVDLCCDCEEFPCELLAPIADGAGMYPHNMKVYNLCRIRAIGIEKCIEESTKLRKKYYTGTFVVGKGQAD